MDWLWCIDPIVNRDDLVFNGIQGWQVCRIPSWPINWLGYGQDKGGQVNGRIS